MALLQVHLLQHERVLGQAALAERVDHDLRTLQDNGLDGSKSAQYYLSQWVREGFLDRSFPAGASEEQYELSAAAAGAIRFVTSLAEQRASATESRLALVINQILRLAAETQTRPAARIEALRRERDRIDREIAAIEAGHLTTLPADRAIERAREAIALSDDLIADFRRVRAAIEQIHRRLREDVMESGETGRGQVLASLFDGVDVVAASAEGQAFLAFWALLTDNEQSAALESALDEVMERDFAGGLQPGERKFLRHLTRNLFREAATIHDVMQSVARSLKSFVRSTEYREIKLLGQAIKEAQGLALQLKDLMRPHHQTGFVLRLSSGQIASYSTWSLNDPSALPPAAGMKLAEQSHASLADLAVMLAHSEIDFRGLITNVEDVLRARSQASIGQVLETHPATQGLGSVVGLLSLADRAGVSTDDTETVEWTGLDGVRRRGVIPTIYFTRERAHELTR